jgi:hypothetical protein
MMKNPILKKIESTESLLRQKLHLKTTSKRLIILALFFVYSCSVVREQNEELSIESEKPRFFVAVPITKFTSFQAPCVNVEIEGKIFLLKLDLGFHGDMTLKKESLNFISSKTFMGEYSTYGVRGKEYKKNSYQIPKLKIGAMAFSPPVLQEENSEFLKDSEFFQSGGDSIPREEEGRIGISLFYAANLLIDIQNSQIAFCDSLDTLKKEGYAIETFIKAPLFLEKGLAEFEANIPTGSLRCILDTGTTWNILNADLADEKSINTAIWEPENMLEYSSFHIEGMDFGPTSFHRMPIRMPIQIEAILGMEFFKNYLVFLDFAGKAVYFSKK